ncbi:hypothetical protein Tsp_04294 [Trichinella spiralis]|uniref:hypothetical protein n=1 Tax=Trichinella spiralis TaxID=6334 RepID=UPI0001EFC11C|nr:hypothetical protein Tsp_04294 [Trichinella spiralis]
MKERLLPVGQDDAHSPDDRLFVAHLLPNCRRFDADHPVRNYHECDRDVVPLNFRSRSNTLHMPVGKRKPQDGLTVKRRGRLVLILNEIVSAVGLLMHSCEMLWVGFSARSPSTAVGRARILVLYHSAEAHNRTC